jgi:transcriptional regulator with XRE-family HTH domain
MAKSAYTGRYRLFREMLREARESRSLKQVDVARRLGKTQSFVSDYERGQRRLDVVEFLMLAEVLKLDLHAVLAKLQR